MHVTHTENTSNKSRIGVRVCVSLGVCVVLDILRISAIYIFYFIQLFQIQEYDRH